MIRQSNVSQRSDDVILQVFKIFDAEAEPHQVVLYPVLLSLLLAQVPILPVHIQDLEIYLSFSVLFLSASLSFSSPSLHSLSISLPIFISLSVFPRIFHSLSISLPRAIYFSTSTSVLSLPKPFHFLSFSLTINLSSTPLSIFYLVLFLSQYLSHFLSLGLFIYLSPSLHFLSNVLSHSPQQFTSLPQPLSSTPPLFHKEKLSNLLGLSLSIIFSDTSFFPTPLSNFLPR